MTNLLEKLTVIVQGIFGEWFPRYLKMTTGAISELLEAIGHAKAIAAALIALAAIAIRTIRKRR